VGLWPFKRSKKQERPDDDDEVRPAEEPPTGVAAWWFAREARRAGSVERFDGAPEIGRAGLHAAATPLGALEHARSDFLCRVVLDGEIAELGSQRAATYRRVSWCVDANEALRPPVQAWIERVLGASLEGIEHHRAAAGDARESVVDAAARVRDARWKLDEGAARADENARARAEGELAGAERRAAEARASAEAHEAAAALLEGSSIDQLARAVDHVVAAYAAFEPGDRDAALDRTRVRLGAELAEALERAETVAPQSVIPSEPPEPEPPPPFATPTEGTACERLVEILRSDVALVGAHPMRPIPGAPGPFALVLERLDDGRDEELLAHLDADGGLASAQMAFVCRREADGEVTLRFSERCMDVAPELLDELIDDAVARPFIPMRGLLDLRARLASHPEVERAAWSRRATPDRCGELVVWIRGDSDHALAQELSTQVDADIAVLGPHWRGRVRVHTGSQVEVQSDDARARSASESQPIYQRTDGLPRGRRRDDPPGPPAYRWPGEADRDPWAPVESLRLCFDVLGDAVHSVQYVSVDRFSPPWSVRGRPVLIVFAERGFFSVVEEALSLWLAEGHARIVFNVRERADGHDDEPLSRAIIGWRPRDFTERFWLEPGRDHPHLPFRLREGPVSPEAARRLCVRLTAARMHVRAASFVSDNDTDAVFVVHVSGVARARAVSAALEAKFPGLPILALSPRAGDSPGAVLTNRAAERAIAGWGDVFWARGHAVLGEQAFDQGAEPLTSRAPSRLGRGGTQCPRCRVTYDLSEDTPLGNTWCGFCGERGLIGHGTAGATDRARLTADCPRCDARFHAPEGRHHARCPACGYAVDPIWVES